MSSVKHQDDKGFNNIGNEGCFNLRKANWPSLYRLDLGIRSINLVQNQIGNEGCKYLSQSQFKKLNRLCLGIILLPMVEYDRK